MPGLTWVQQSLITGMFSWAAPYSLQGVPILGYELDVHVYVQRQHTTNGEALSTSHVSTNMTCLNISIPNNTICLFINFSIHAVNPVGLGVPEERIVYITKSKQIIH